MQDIRRKVFIEFALIDVVDLEVFNRALERGGVSVECRDQIFYSAGCRLEKHSVECLLGIITPSFILHGQVFKYHLLNCVFMKLGVKCRGKF